MGVAKRQATGQNGGVDWRVTHALGEVGCCCATPIAYGSYRGHPELHQSPAFPQGPFEAQEADKDRQEGPVVPEFGGLSDSF